MANFNAGAIEATLTLDRSPFIQGLRAARGQAKKIEDDGIDVKVDVDKTELDEVQDDIRAMSKEEKIEFSIETAEAERRLKNFEDEADRTRRRLERDTKIELKADLDAAKARAQLALLARNRLVNLTVRIANFSRIQATLASLGKITVALSGANVITNRLRAIKDQLENIDKIAYRMGGLTYLFGNLANLLLTAGANLWTLIGSLGQLGGLLIPLPVVLGGLVTAVGAAAIAFTGWGQTGEYAVQSMQDMLDVLDELTPAWNTLLKEVRVAAWEGMADVFERFANHVFPTFQAGLVGTAEGLNLFGKILLTSLTNVPTGVYENIFAGINSSLRIATGGIQPFIDAFATLGSVGSDNLDRFAQAITNALDRFNVFVQTAAQNGDLQAWIDNAAIAWGDLMTVLGEAGGILNGFADAFKAAGSTTLGTLADTLARIHGIVDTPVFQYGLTTIFTGVLQGAEGLSQALGPVGDMLAGMAPTIGYLASQIGMVLGAAITGLAGAINTPAFQTGLVAFFDGIANGILAIVPYLPQITAGLGAIGEIAGAILANVGPALGALLAGLSDVLIALAPSLLLVVDALGTALMDTIVRLIPALEPLILAIGDLAVALSPVIVTVVSAIVDMLVALSPAVAAVAVALVPLIQAWAQWVPLITGIAVDIIQLLAQNMVILSPAIMAVAQMFLQLMTAVQPLIPEILRLFDAMLEIAVAIFPVFLASLPQIRILFDQFLAAVVPIIPDLLEMTEAFIELAAAMLPIVVALVPPFIALIQACLPIVTALAQILIGGLSVAMHTAGNAIDGVTSLVRGMTTSLRDSLGSVRETASNMVEAFSGIRDKIQGVFSNAGDWLKDAANRIINGFTAAIRGAFEKVRSAFNELTNLIPDWKGPKSRDKILLKDNANLIMGGFINQIEANRSPLRRKLGQVTDDIRLGGSLGTGTPVPSVLPTGAGGSGNGTVISEGALQVRVEVPNAMNEEQVGTHVATKLGLLLSNGAVPVLQPVGP